MSDEDVPMIYHPALEKAKALREDPERYFRIVHAQRRAHRGVLPIPSDDEAAGDAS